MPDIPVGDRATGSTPSFTKQAEICQTPCGTASTIVVQALLFLTARRFHMRRALSFMCAFGMLVSPARAQSVDATPVKIGDAVVSSSLRTRMYSWNWFGDTPNGDYTYSGSLLRNCRRDPAVQTAPALPRSSACQRAQAPRTRLANRAFVLIRPARSAAANPNTCSPHSVCRRTSSTSTCVSGVSSRRPRHRS